MRTPSLNLQHELNINHHQHKFTRILIIVIQQTSNSRLIARQNAE